METRSLQCEVTKAPAALGKGRHMRRLNPGSGSEQDHPTGNSRVEEEPHLCSVPLPGKLGMNSTANEKRVNRGLTAAVSTTALQRAIWLRTLLLTNRFRVIRTVDVAALCFAERTFKAALTAAQRAMRGLVRAALLKRYRTDRFQTVYGLTQKGVEWLDEEGVEATSSVRRVSDMTNPEHRLWAQFLVVCCEARGLMAMTEQELLQKLNKAKSVDEPNVQGLLDLDIRIGKRTIRQSLRPDLVSVEAGEVDGLTWYEVDRSKRGSGREASLAALTSSVGCSLTSDIAMRRVVVFCRSERVLKRAKAVVAALARESNDEVLTQTRRHFVEVEPGTYEVRRAVLTELSDGRSTLVDTVVGHVIIQLLPTWLPKVRIDKRNQHSTAGWFSENYLPYARPTTLPSWPALQSNLQPASKPGKAANTPSSKSFGS